MKQKILKMTSITIIIVLSISTIIEIYKFIRVKTAKVEIGLKDDRIVDFASKKKVSDFIESINGKIIDDYVIDSTTNLGKKEISFKFINDDGIKITYSYDIEIVDRTPPTIWLNKTYSIPVGSKVNLLDEIMCGDNVDDEPNCYIEGTYNRDKVGTYPLVFNAIDSSGNKTIKKFNLKVYKPKKSNTQTKTTPIYFEDILKTYKMYNNRIGIDVSKWQEDIDFEKVKQVGVEFVMIRVGTTNSKTNEFILDPKFKQNIENAKKAGLDVGVYFYSYANTRKRAREEAKWVIDQIKDYNITLPVVFDWEDWSDFNHHKVSFFSLTKVAEEFLRTIEKKGYTGMLYSSKTYLENIWFETKYDIWLAHYTKNTDYKGKYKMWQVTNKGKVDGINTLVDINVLYY